mmetsp:Transcript_4405/g.15564  ORF Transcript_4405/g.15564 Transcript_4405/m.15564 type:complete len:233 (+) Transcript_4405:336-1034(+)
MAALRGPARPGLAPGLVPTRPRLLAARPLQRVDPSGLWRAHRGDARVFGARRGVRARRRLWRARLRAHRHVRRRRRRVGRHVRPPRRAPLRHLQGLGPPQARHSEPARTHGTFHRPHPHGCHVLGGHAAGRRLLLGAHRRRGDGAPARRADPTAAAEPAGLGLPPAAQAADVCAHAAGLRRHHDVQRLVVRDGVAAAARLLRLVQPERPRPAVAEMLLPAPHLRHRAGWRLQ